MKKNQNTSRSQCVRSLHAYTLLGKAEGKWEFYSCDFRGHGRKEMLFEAKIENPPSGPDVPLTEGTTVGRAGTKEGFATEIKFECEFI